MLEYVAIGTAVALVIIGVIWGALYRRETLQSREHRPHVDRYLVRVDLAEGGEPTNVFEVIIKAVLTKTAWVFAVLIFVGALGLGVSLIIESEAGTTAFTFLTVIYLAAAAFFLGWERFDQRYFPEKERSEHTPDDLRLSDIPEPSHSRLRASATRTSTTDTSVGVPPEISIAVILLTLLVLLLIFIGIVSGTH